MGDLSVVGLLEAWERGLSRPAPERPLALLGAACAGRSPEELARLPVGERDTRLLDLRESVFGTGVEAAVRCPGCGDPLDLSLAVEDLRTASEADPSSPLVIAEGGYEVRVRLPNTEDLSEVARSEDEREARRRLFERCLVEVRHGGAPVAAGRVPEKVVTAVSEAMDRVDPQAGIEVALECPECGHGWRSPFDVASFLWTETDRWARRTLEEVHALASAYGWSEAEVLGLTARRRQVYLDLIGE